MSARLNDPLLPGSATTPQWIQWQLADSAFPSGGFSHSGGLETLYQHRQVRSGSELAQFLETALGAVGRSLLPFVNSSFDHPDQSGRQDAYCDAFLSNHVANRSSRRQGRAFLQAVQEAFANPTLSVLAADLKEGPRHLPVVFGAASRGLELSRTSAQQLFLFGQLRGWVSAAIRLGMLGPFEGQRIQHSLYPVIEALLPEVEGLAYEEASQTSPLLEIFHAGHDRLYSRLFQS